MEPRIARLNKIAPRRIRVQAASWVTELHGPDRNPELEASGLSEQSGSGINLFVSSDQVRFYRNQHEIPLDEVPAVVYSEIMRDVDLFTSVCAIGTDEQWTDQ